MGTSSWSPLASLYAGAQLGQSYSSKLGSAQAGSEDVDQQIRGNLLQTAVATGKINPASLSSQDAALLAVHIAQPHSGGVLHDILGAIETPFKIGINTAGDLASAVEGIPQGLLTLGEAAYRTLNPIGNTINRALGFGGTKTPGGPNLSDVGKAIVQGTVHDFTHFDPMHPLYPILDVAGLASGGLGLAGKAAGAASRLADTGEAGSLTSKVGEAARSVGAFIYKDRPPLLIHPTTGAYGDAQLPELPIGAYSVSPFRRFFVERPIDAFFQSGLANTPLPGLSEGTTLNDLRSAYHIRKIANVTRGRTSSTAINETTRATQGFNHAMKGLVDESANESEASLKFNALVLGRELGLDYATPAERDAALELYREKVLATGGPYVEGVPKTVEADRIRNFYRNLTASSQFRRFFSEPTPAMMRVKEEWDKAVIEGQKALNINPHHILNHALGPLGHILDRSPEEVLREQPELVQAQSRFARSAYDLETAIRDAKPGESIPETALIPKIAADLPGTATLQQKVDLIHRAVDSLNEDIAGLHSRRDLLNNADQTGYLPGNGIAQKVATALHDELGVDAAIAEGFAYGGFSNYFPQAAATGMKVIRRGPIGQAMDKLKRRESTPQLKEYRRGNTARLLNAESLGVAPYASFLQEADLSWFKAGVDRRDPSMFVRHIQQRERVLAHRLLAEPLIGRLALKDSEGRVLTFGSDAELQDKLGSVVAAQKWRLLPPAAIQKLIQSEDEAGKELADALRETDGKITPEVTAQFDKVIDESAQNFVRQLTDEVIAKKDGMVAVPASYVNNLINHARVLDAARGPGRLWQGFINRWRSAVLAYMPSWVLRTSIGHGVILFIGGVWNPVHYFQAMNYFGEGFKVPGTDVYLSKGLDRHVPAGVEQGSPHEDFGKFGAHNIDVGKMAQLTTGTVHRVMNVQRRAAFLSFLRKAVGEQQFNDLGEAMKIPFGFAKTQNIDKILENHPELVKQALDELDRVSYTFGQMSPWERRLAKNILPFWGWYKFVSKFVWSLPFTYPGRTLAIARLGQLGQSEMDSLGPIPDWLRSSIMFDTHNLAAVHYMSMLGLNPLGDVINPAGGFQGLVRLGQMSPVIQAALEGAGYNTLTGGLESIDPSSGIVEVNGKYVDLSTGKEYDNPGMASVGASVARSVGGLMRAFPEIRIAEEALTGGKPLYPESIPIINERPIPSTNPPKDTSPLGIALQYMGVAPKTYNLQKYQINLLKDIVRARTTMAKAIAKEKALK